MPASRAARMTATPCSRGIRSYVRHDPSDITDTSIPDEPSARTGSPSNWCERSWAMRPMIAHDGPVGGASNPVRSVRCGP